MNKRLVSILSAMALVICSMGTSYATTVTVDPVAGTELEAQINVDATIIDVEIPITWVAGINPQAGDKANDKGYFTSGVHDVVNNSSAPVTFSFYGFEADPATTAKVVQHDKRTVEGWYNLGKLVTAQEIGLGLKLGVTDVWSTPEADGVPALALGSINVPRYDKVTAEIVGKHGLSFDSATVLKYKGRVRVGLAD